MTTGHGAKFPAAPFNAVWWNSTDYSDSSDDPNVEVIRVTAISTDTLTVTRGQEGITATTKNTGGKTYKISQSFTADFLNSQVMPNVLTTRGDLVRRGASLPERVALGGRGSSFVSDGTDAVWRSERSVLSIVDDFLGGAVGTHAWTARAIGSGSTSTHDAGDSTHPGASQIRSGTTSGAGQQLGLGPNSALTGITSVGTTAWQLEFKFKFTTSQTNARFRAGLMSGGTVVEPTDGVWLRYDVNASYSDTAFQLVCRAASANTTISTGVSPVLDQWHHCKIRCTGDGVIRCSVDGAAEVTINSGLPSASIGLGFIHCTNSTVDQRLNMDWWWYELATSR